MQKFLHSVKSLNTDAFLLPLCYAFCLWEGNRDLNLSFKVIILPFSPESCILSSSELLFEASFLPGGLVLIKVTHISVPH